MTQTRLRAPAVVIAVMSLASIPLAGQGSSVANAPAAAGAATKTGTAPRTPWGDPDLQGTWTNNSATPFERPKELEGRQFLTDQEVANLKQNAARLVYSDNAPDGLAGDGVFLAALRNAKNQGGVGLYNQFWFVERTFDNRTSMIADPPDGKIPPMTPEAQKREAAKADYRRLHPADRPEDIALSQRCITRGVPGAFFISGYNSYYQILQAPGYVVMHMEMFHDARIIPLDGRPHLPTRSWLGDSRGHWQGDTLVVDTINFSPKTDYRGASANLHLIERFTRVDPKTLKYELTINDPTTWTKPWTVMIPLAQAQPQDKLYEFACHEGNHSLVNVLLGARYEEKTAAAKR